MTLINRSALYIQDTTSWVYLPPFNLDADIKRKVHMSVDDVPFGATNVQSRIAGWTIDVTGVYKGSSPSAGLLFQDSLRDAFFDSDGLLRLVDIQVWDDSTNSIKRVYRDCQIYGDVDFGRHGGRTASMGTYSFSLISKDTSAYSTVTGGSNAPEGPYEAYLYNGATGASTVVSYDSIDVQFIGAIDAAAGAGNVNTHQIEITPNMDRAVRITAIEIINCAGMFGTTGTTTIRVSDTNYASDGNYIDVSIDYDETKATPAQGSISIAAQSKIYVYPTAAGNHLSPQVRLHMEVL